MLTFFKHVGVGIISAFTAFTGAFHSQVPQTIQTTPTATTTQGANSADTSVPVNKTPSKTAPSKPVVIPTVSAPVATTPAPVTTQVLPANYLAYENLPSDFPKNPPYYIGTRVKITGKIVDFMAAGDRGGTSNYIEIIPTPYQPVGTPYLALRISPTDYQKAVQNLNISDTVTAYGTVSTSQSFIDTNDALSVLTPVADTIRLDKCNSYPCSVNLGTWTIFPYVPIAKNQIASMDTVGRNLDLYLNTSFTTEGSVAKIFDPTSDGNSLVYIQDQNMNRLSFVVSSSYLVNNQIKVGSVLDVTGTLLSKTNGVVDGVYINNQVIESTAPYFMSNTTVTLVS